MNNRIKNYCFVFLCFFIYQFLYNIKQIFDLSVFHLELLLILYIVLIVFIIKRTRYLNDLYIFKLSNNLKIYKYCIPLLMIPVINVIDDYSLDFNNILLCILAVFMEEIFFRGILIKTFNHLSLNRSFLISSFIFSFYHLTNIFGGLDIIYVFLQVLLSFFLGYHLCFITLKMKSLLPAIVIHFLINITGSGEIGNIYSFLVCIMVLLFYFIYIFRLLVREE